MATVYLLHFLTPYKHAQHYLGATSLPLEKRLAAHRGEVLYEGDQPYGRAAKLLAAAHRAGVSWVVADTWECDTKADAFALERKLKKQGGRKMICSICNPENRRGTRGQKRRKGEGD